MARTPSERGAVGLPLFSGQLSLDTNVRLRGLSGIKIYREMASDEPAASAFLSACATLLRTDLTVVPGGSKGADKKAAQFLESCLEDQRDALGVQIRQMFSAIVYGYSVSEVIYKRRSGGAGSKYDDGLVGWSAWAYRRQDSFHKWEVGKNGRIEGWTQRPAPDYVLRTIPLTKAIHLIADDREGSPEGVSALRGMYRQWHFVKNLELLLGISLERFGTGVPVFEIDEDVKATLTEEQTDTLEAIAAGLRQNEEAYVITPAGIKFRFAESPGLTAKDYLDTIQKMRIWMLATVLADFIALGTDGGSYALGKDKSELFLLALNGYQDRLVTALNRQAVPKLFRYNNFGKLTDLPQLSLPAVRRYDLGAMGSFLQVLQNIGGFHVTPEDEAHFRKISDFIDLDEKTLRELHKKEEQPEQDAAPEEDSTPVQNGTMDEDIEDLEEVAA